MIIGRNTMNTAVNTTKVPSILRELSFSGKLVFDYGCGRCSDLVKKHAYDNGAVEYRRYDKYWNIGRKPSIAEYRIYDLVICANVLNVIENPIERYEVLKDLSSLISGAKGATVAIQIYEGDKSGIGRETSKGYQLNRKRADYYNEIREHFPVRDFKIREKRNYFIITWRKFI